MFEDYFKFNLISNQNDSALIKCLRFDGDDEDLFKKWVAKESNLSIDTQNVLERVGFIKEQKLKLKNLCREDKEQLLNFLARLLSAKFSGCKQAEIAISLTIDKLVYCFENKKPIIFIFGFGGYKNYNSPSFPEVDIAELFHMKYMTTFLWPIITTYKYGVQFEYESEEISIQFNNVPQESTDRYTTSFQKLLNYFCEKVYEVNKVKLDYKLVIARNMYKPQDLYDRMKLYYEDMKRVYDDLPQEEKAVWFKRAKTNFLIEGTNDYTKCSEDELNQLIINARINNECFLAADYELRIDFWERPNAISLFGTWGKSPCASPTDGGLHLKSTAASNTDFWIGTGVLKLNENNEVIQELILSQNQFAEVRDSLKEITNEDLELLKISKNFKKLKYIQ